MASKIRSQLLALIYFCLLLVLLPLILLFVLVPVGLIRVFVIVCAKCIMGSKFGRMLGGISGIHAVDEITSDPKGNLIVSLYMEAGLHVETLRPRFVSGVVNKKTQSGRNLQYPELRQYVSSFMGFSFWNQDKDFNAENHIFYYKSPEDIDEARLQMIREEFARKPWAEKRPLWEFIIIENFRRYKGESGSGESQNYTPVILFRAHHCLLDGFSILNILVEDLANLSLEKVIAKTSPPTSKLKTIKEPSALRKLWKKFTFPVRALSEFSLELTTKPDVNAWHDPNTKLTRKGTFTFSNPISVDYIKQIKNTQQVSFTSVILAGICSGIRRGMEDNSLKVPEFIDCFAAFPVKSHPKILTNHMTHCLIRLPTGDPDRRSRLLKIEDNLQKAKKSTLPIINFFMSRIIGSFPRNIIKKAVSRTFPATVAVSNFPGPNELWSVNGINVYKIQFDAGPILGLGIGYFCLTYNGKASVFAGVDNALGNSVSISKSLIQYFEEEMDLLSESLP